MSESNFFQGCSSSRCGNSSASCNHYHDSGCPKEFSRPWVMCKDSTGLYHCKPHGKVGNAVHQSGLHNKMIEEKVVRVYATNSICTKLMKHRSVQEDVIA